jgi:phage baseplate assembly protein V
MRQEWLFYIHSDEGYFGVLIMKEDVAAMFRDMFRIGEVVGTKPENCTARVQFKDADGMVSGDLQIIYCNTLKNKDYWLPDVGEIVVCIFLGNGQTSGFVLGSVYNAESKPPAGNQDKWAKEFEDGTRIEYDRKENKLNIDINGDVILHIEKDKDVKISGNLNLEASEANINCPAINLGTDANLGVVHEASPCPLYGVFHLNPSQTTKTAP